MGELSLGQENIFSTKLEEMSVITNKLTVLTVQVKAELANRNHFLLITAASPDPALQTQTCWPPRWKEQFLASLPVNAAIILKNRIPFWAIRIIPLKSRDAEIL